MPTERDRSVKSAPEVLLVAAVGAVGVLHTMVPDHWAPIALLARQQRWSSRTTARFAVQAGTGHVVSTLAIGLIVWFVGVAFATRFGQMVSALSSIALIAFGGWIAIASWRELHGTRPPHDHEAALTGGAVTSKRSTRTALLLILGSSPMVEGIPAFFAAAKYGAGLLAIMAAVFAASTIATYAVLCVSSAAGLQRLRFGRLETYGEVLSGAFIAVVGIVFLAFPLM